MAEQESINVDVLIVGCGSAALSLGIHLKNLASKENLNPTIAILEKAESVGGHSVSGAVLNPIALNELIPNHKELNSPVTTSVSKEQFHFLSKSKNLRLPVPPSLKNKGNYVISVSKFNRWLSEIAIQKGADIFTGFSAVETLYDSDRVIGVKTSDMGLDKHSKPKTNFEQGIELKAKVTVFAEGPRGSLFSKVCEKLNLRSGKAPDTYSEGVKEIIQVNEDRFIPGTIIHTLGYPLKKSVGGTFLYAISKRELVIGLVGYLNTIDPLFDPHRYLQQLKVHPFIHKMIKGGEVVSYAARCIPSGGYNSMPRLFADGMLVIGDSAGMVDDQKLKGIHLGMKSGILAAETILDCIKENDFSKKSLGKFEDRVSKSYIKNELYKVRNFHHSLSPSIIRSIPSLLFQKTKSNIRADYKTTLPVLDVWGEEREKEINSLPKPDGKLFLDKLSSVYLTKTKHDEDSPNHLKVHDTKICSDSCYETFNSPCHFFCPANVYEMIPQEGKHQLQVNFTNCIHCKACDIKCPHNNISWTAPEGGGGPGYTDT